MLFRYPLLAFLPLCLAQNYGSSPSSASSSSAQPSSTSSAIGSIQTVTVGKSGFVFSPDSLTVAPGGKVVFQYYPGGHSMTQADFAKPCQPSNSSSINSGFVNSSNGPASQVWTVQINSTDPIWFYCAQVGHCQGGMVGVINPPSGGDQTLDAFKSAAANSQSSTMPAQVQGGTLGAPPSSTTTSGSVTTSPKSGNAPLSSLGLCSVLAAVVLGLVAKLV